MYQLVHLFKSIAHSAHHQKQVILFTKIRKKLHFDSFSDTFFYILNKNPLNAVKSVLSLQFIVTPLLSCNHPINKSSPLR